ncbi:3826_t:CDS:2 [Funneliformis geosporum]|nr:3826_t:CDS:2 [Funneliformis geosporum]
MAVSRLVINQSDGKVISSPIYAFNPNSGHWNLPIIKGKIPEWRRDIQDVADKFGNIYIFGGYSIITANFLNDIIILNINDLIWSYGPIDNADLKRDSYTATLLTNGMIVYIGGREINSEVDINKINLYDTRLSFWSLVQAKSNGQIESRYGHSAILVSDEKIIIYGGKKGESSKSIKVIPDLVILNIQTTPFEWIIPQISTNIGKVPSLSSHSANLVENYMIIAFGQLTFPNGLEERISSKNIYLLDTKNYSWVDKFDPITSNTTSPSPSPTTTNTTLSDTAKTNNVQLNTIIGTISGILCTAILMTIGIFGYKWYQKRKQSEIMRIFGDGLRTQFL